MSYWKTLVGNLVLVLGFLLKTFELHALEPPAHLVWQTQALPELIGSPKAKKGGRLITSITHFPLTLRQVGPDSSDAFRRLLDENDLSLIVMHPNNQGYLPLLATHWALAGDGRTVYYRLNPIARWSDQKPVRASDYTFTLEFMRSPFIQSPWSNEFYTKTIERVDSFQEKDGTEVIAVKLAKADTDWLALTNLKPTPRHFYGTLDAQFISRFNWQLPPNVGPYTLASWEKARRLVFRRKLDWWARDMPFFKNRFNVDEILLKPIGDIQLMFAYLKAGDIDAMTLTSPDLWHASPLDDAFALGYIHRLQAYNDAPRSDYALILNRAFGLFQDGRVRQAFAFSMNIERIIKELLRGDFQRLQGISQGYAGYTNPEIKARPFDLLKADELLQEAGWGQRNKEGIRIKDGQTLTAVLTYSQSNITPRFLLLQEDARKAGFEIKLQILDQAMAFKSFREKKHDIAFMAWTTPFRPEYRSRFHSEFANKGPNSNFSNSANPQLDQMIEAYDASSKESEKMLKAHAIQRIVHDEATYVPLFEVPFYRLAYWGWIQFPEKSGTKVTDGWSFFDAAVGGLFWIDADQQKKILDARKKKTRLPPVTRLDESYHKK